ncbi:MAG: copper amine oxidase N-terminal domain-containing protein [Oscillospiraceae bacterium]|nr:copper amine oxidase N-terminal domain-containing protein [Oscillospiraceae bacterium]
MKRKIIPIISGALAMLLAGTSAVTALAASGAIQIEVNPISVLVDGEVFQPKDANGDDVMLFTYNGTTYAPLRALAEAYGLEVGYDEENNIATVSSSSVIGTDYSGFESVWTVKEKPVTDYGNEKIYTAAYSGELSISEFKEWWKSLGQDAISEYAERMVAEVQSTAPDCVVTVYFSYGQYNLGTVHAESAYTGSNFDAAGVCIK